MKKLFTLAMATLILGACDEDTETAVPKQISEDFVEINSSETTYIIEYRHVPTGCHYMQLDSYSDSIIQMYIDKDGQSVPYCD